MQRWRAIGRAARWRKLEADRAGNVALIFALVAGLLVMLIAGVANIGGAINRRAQAQDVIDGAALAGAKLMLTSTATDADIIATARTYIVNSRLKEAGVRNSTITVDRPASEVNIRYDENFETTFQTALLDKVIHVGATSVARIGGVRLYPVCILVTEPTDNHTLRASDGSKTDLNNCLVQVNTNNWDAVEAKDDAYIHINNGQNCYVGNIHFGDVLPEKMPTCKLFADPFASIKVSPPTTCEATKLEVSQKNPHPAPLTPGTYCGGLNIKDDVTFKPGVYYIKDGLLNIEGSEVDVTATGVTFVFVGDGTGLSIKSGNRLSFSPAAAADAGVFDGFVFYLDQSAATDPVSTSQITGAKVMMSGVLYLNGQHLVFGKNADVAIKPGTIIASYILPQGGNLNFTGSLPSVSAAAAALQKKLPSSVPSLVR